jgi:hypothetical protein
MAPGYYDRIRELADEQGFDGCTMATGARRDCCAEHDFHYRHHQRLDGSPLGKDDIEARRVADLTFLRCMQRRGWLGWWSPLAWLRYAAVRIWGGAAWAQGGARRG